MSYFVGCVCIDLKDLDSHGKHNTLFPLGYFCTDKGFTSGFSAESLTRNVNTEKTQNIKFLILLFFLFVRRTI